jgi:hypothetical protein
MLARSGVTTSLCVGVPSDGTQMSTDAAVIALKIGSGQNLVFKRPSLKRLVCRQGLRLL